MTEDVHEIISYSSDCITSIRNNENGISKKVHKQIFANRIWKPRSIQHREKQILMQPTSRESLRTHPLGSPHRQDSNPLGSTWSTTSEASTKSHQIDSSICGRHTIMTIIHVYNDTEGHWTQHQMEVTLICYMCKYPIILF